LARTSLAALVCERDREKNGDKKKEKKSGWDVFFLLSSYKNPVRDFCYRDIFLRLVV
jgi:hypothetical protein